MPSINEKLDSKLSKKSKSTLYKLTSLLEEYVIFDVDNESVMIYTKINDVKYLIGYLHNKDEFNFYIHRYELGQIPNRLYGFEDITTEIKAL